jgi:hypothetical protein
VPLVRYTWGIQEKDGRPGGCSGGVNKVRACVCVCVCVSCLSLQACRAARVAEIRETAVSWIVARSQALSNRALFGKRGLGV